MYLSDKEFSSIYSKVPRLAIDLYICSNQGVLLSLRSIEPYSGYWHLPGGTIYKNETLEEAAVRIAKTETGLKITPAPAVGSMEFLHEERCGTDMHTISIVIPAFVSEGVLETDKNATQLKWFTELPKPLVREHEEFLRVHFESLDFVQNS